MSNFNHKIRPHVDAELHRAAALYKFGAVDAAFRHLERAHVLGQASTRQHVRAHWHMLRWAMAQQQRHEIVGQMLRIVGAATLTAVGLVPSGNTGGANISPWRRMPVPADLAAVLESVITTP